MPDRHLGDALRAVADQIERSGSLPDLGDLYRRGRTRRRRRLVAATTLSVLLITGTAVAQTEKNPQTNPPASPTPAPSRSGDPLLEGKREVSIARTPKTAVSMDGGFLTEVDDDSGRQLFLLTPLGGGEYLIKAFGPNINHPASDEPACWQVYREPGQPLTVQGAVCDPANPDQKFTIKTPTPQTYAISNAAAYLKRSPTGGLILGPSEPGTFRFTDQGPARKPAGG
ncbi:MAG: hypothetical protein ABW000_18275 [Actinoplanes sp.]